MMLSRWIGIVVFLLLLTVGSVVLLLLVLHSTERLFTQQVPSRNQLFTVQSIDTMKESRDRAAYALDNLSAYKLVVDQQMQLIQEAGATHVAIGTPYDQKFSPVLRLWVASARAHHLSVWFRGNFSGWEGWFNFAKITPDQHKTLLASFLRNNASLFENGDVFTSCPECENGGPGDPRQTGNITEYSTLLVSEKKIAQSEFLLSRKDVTIYTSMNADIARNVLSSSAITQLGGTVLIDHYVDTPEHFDSDIATIPNSIGATIGVGEFGAPVPDLNGTMTDDEQAAFIEKQLWGLYRQSDRTPLVNYWTLSQGSTALLNDAGQPKKAYFVIKNFYTAPKLYGTVADTLGGKVPNSTVEVLGSGFMQIVQNKKYEVFLPGSTKTIKVSAPGYITQTFTATHAATSSVKDFYLVPTHPSWRYSIRGALEAVRKKLHLGSSVLQRGSIK